MREGVEKSKVPSYRAVRQALENTVMNMWVHKIWEIT
jgi:hypothetical protein